MSGVRGRKSKLQQRCHVVFYKNETAATNSQVRLSDIIWFSLDTYYFRIRNKQTQEMPVNQSKIF